MKWSNSVLHDWILDSLRSGQALPRRVAEEVDLSDYSFGFIGTSESGQDLRYGRRGTAPTGLLAPWVGNIWPNAEVLVGLPLFRLTDPHLSSVPYLWRVISEEVYAWDRIREDRQNQVNEVLHAHHPTFLYVGLIFDEFPNGWVIEVGEVDVTKLEGIIVGAHDGEAFVYCRRNHAK
ncbi:hypothetical protein CGZ91_11790 [Parenemella sanctibonifatiensis]|uniref:Uncharacterized protein n=2 Tax=Parenemella sanctibonifatiensis TaxID=2016505 RepID=A0A255EH76_9ACTN|nr:hypothetical protein CGZ91_11790 [Parenemella sanctibonifatiensis]